MTMTVLPMSRSSLSVLDQARVVAVVEADTRFVEDVEYAHEPRTDLGGETKALRFAAGQRGGAAIEGEVAEPDVVEEISAAI